MRHLLPMFFPPAGVDGNEPRRFRHDLVTLWFGSNDA
eukprot:gene31831-21123_t